MAALALFCAILALQFPAAASSTDTRPFPFLYQGTDASELTPLIKELAALEALDRVRLSGVALPRTGGKKDILTLDLRRVRIGNNESRVAVDGVITNRKLEMDTTMWAGKVEGAPISDVYLSFSRYGSRGWIAFQNQRFELVAAPDENGNWENSISTFMAAGESFLASASGSVRCGNVSPNTTAPKRTVFTGVLPTIAAPQTAAVTFFTCTLAVETDYQYYHNIFNNNLNAAQNYATALLGAVAARFLGQVNVQINVIYLGLHTNVNDPWVAPDFPTGVKKAEDLRIEFADKWKNGAAPITANLYHFLSGSIFDGGSANGSDFCAAPSYNNSGNFGVSTGVDGQVQFPVMTTTGITADFRTVAHELGHNFHAPHTHWYCPPIDQCAAPNFPETCYTSQPTSLCTTQEAINGTLMSYCYVCQANLTNITSIYFHPQSVADMRAYLMSTCAGIPVGAPTIEPFANLPIGGVPHEDARIARFVDLDPTAGIKDFDCGTLTSDGCRETDINLIGYAQRDIGVPVFAVSDGVVIGIDDGFPDLNTPVVGPCNQPYAGNYVKISHGSGISTFYGALKNGSISVINGQRVRSGEQIGFAGSSGCIDWPRVFVEASGPGGAIFDPNAGTCNIPTLSWVNNIGKPATPALNAFYITKDSPPTIFPPYQAPTTGQIAASATGFYYITVYSYLPVNCEIRRRLFLPGGTLYLESTHKFNNPTPIYTNWAWWHFFLGSPFQTTGTWTLQLDINGTTVVIAPFEVVTTVNPTLNHAPNPITVAFSPAAPKVTDPITCRVTSANVANDLDYDIVYYNYRWLVNGAVVREKISAGRADVLSHHVALDGQTVSCEVTPKDGKNDGNPTTISVAIAPTPNAVAYDSAVLFEKNSGVLTTVNSISNSSGMAVLNLLGGIPFEQFSFGFSENNPFTFPISAILPGNSGSFVIDVATSSFTDSPYDIFGPGGRATLSVPFNPNPVLIGQQFQLQWMVYDPSFFQIVLSHGLLVTIIP